MIYRVIRTAKLHSKTLSKKNQQNKQKKDLFLFNMYKLGLHVYLFTMCMLCAQGRQKIALDSSEVSDICELMGAWN